MASSTTPTTGDPPRDHASRGVVASRLRGTIEGGVLALVCLAPWAFGGTAPKYVFLLEVALAGLAALWGALMLVEGELRLRNCPVAACLAALVLVSAWQMVPLPKGMMRLVSPATARMYEGALPSRPEVLPGGAPRDDPSPPAGSTLSVDPGATRRKLARLLAVLLLFTLVRYNVDPAGGLRRLGLAALANGSLLSAFGLAQFFSSDPQTIYWSYRTAGGPFGPFINRNHFAFYVNLCMGAGAGLFLAWLSARDGLGSAADRAPRGRPRPGGRGSPARPLRPPERLPEAEVLGFAFALGLMAAGVVVSLSRGGLVALAGGSLLAMTVWALRSRRSARGNLLVLVPAVATALVLWLGYEAVAARLATLWSGEALREHRPAIWARALRVARDFPLWGTGAGTFELADMWHRTDAADSDVLVDHAHNDYLELLVEGGLAQLVPGVLAVVLVFRLGLRAVARLEGEPAGGLALGAIAGFATLAIHSFSDFGLQIPSCAALATVACALLCGLGDRGHGAPPRAEGPAPGAVVDRSCLRLRGRAPALGAAASVLMLGLLVAHEGWRAHRVQQLRDTASRLDRSGDPARLVGKASLLEAASRLVPEDARLQDDAASAHLSALEQGMFELREGGLDGAATLDAGNRPGRIDDAAERLGSEHLTPALRHLLRSRDLSPMRAMVQLALADQVAGFAAADPRAAYLDRAKLLAPADPDLWYRCGAHELADGRPDRAWASWRRSLELSDAHLPEILDRGRERLDAHAMLAALLPARPGLLMEAARHIHPQSRGGRRPFLEAALALLGREAGPPTAERAHTRAVLLRDLGRPAEASEAYREALLRAPGRTDWRYERAELANEQGWYEEAHQELLTILALEPKNAPARALLDVVARGLAETRAGPRG